MIQESFPVGLLQCTCTLLGDETSRQALVVDPGDDIPRILSRLAHHQLTVKAIVITHAHIDHIAGALTLKDITHAPILYNQLDLPILAMMGEQAAWLGVPIPKVAPPDDDLADGAYVTVPGIRATVLHTPGHTPGSICLHLPAENLLLSGDTLFAGTVGRTDFPLGDARTLLNSLHERVLPLPDHTRIVPGHGRPTTMHIERASNPFCSPDIFDTLRA